MRRILIIAMLFAVIVHLHMAAPTQKDPNVNNRPKGLNKEGKEKLLVKADMQPLHTSYNIRNFALFF